MTKPNAYKGWWLVKELLGNFNCNPSRWAAHCTHTHAESRNCYFDFTCRNVWAQAIWWKRIGKPEQKFCSGLPILYLLVALAWLPLTNTARFVLLLILLENQRSASFSAGKLSEMCLVEFGEELCMVFSKLGMFPTCFVQRVTNLQLETWPGSKASGSIKKRVKTTAYGCRTGRRHGRWLAAMQQSGTYFFPLRGGPCQSCDSWNWNWFEHVMPSGHPCSGTKQGVPKIVASNWHHWLWRGAFWTVDWRLVMTCHDLIPCLLMFVNRFTWFALWKVLDVLAQKKKIWKWGSAQNSGETSGYAADITASWRVSAGHSKRWEFSVENSRNWWILDGFKWTTAPLA